MATKNRNVMCYLPAHLEEKLIQYAYNKNLTRHNSKKNKTEPRLGTAIIEVLKDYFESASKYYTESEDNKVEKYSPNGEEYNTKTIKEVKDSINKLQEELYKMAEQLDNQQVQITNLEESKLSHHSFENWAEFLPYELKSEGFVNQSQEVFSDSEQQTSVDHNSQKAMADSPQDEKCTAENSESSESPQEDIKSNNDDQTNSRPTKENSEANKKGYSKADLAKRLGVSQTAVWKQRDKGSDSFREWSKQRDPDGIPWEFDQDDGPWGRYHPVSIENVKREEGNRFELFRGSK